ncbi:SpoIVB peptidase [Halolactibacillus alkaliphilus]|uniref:SpoIVB peptidase n=1 Tax=Halolactibacillus alkaliphilus TaxID=442899 RepID=A0A511X2Q3_9BACI|nr:SpoIVB peptidase [Halolactibacillus alkaliphilus]GEN57223.1 SpoIVB peptidase [Halolactibacillus alkaliphilus]GGN68762.1 SpoIVB peptidase [Halolactibacillus alkaliphilus]SFO72975.1 stage IV sporulation protein B [Halolactibacillus alkaliphilus]
MSQLIKQSMCLMVLFFLVFVPTKHHLYAENLPRAQLVSSEVSGMHKNFNRNEHDQSSLEVGRNRLVQANTLLIPSGQSIGMQLEGEGVVIVGFEEVEQNNERTSPGKEAGCEVGDIIVAINDQLIRKMSDVTSFLAENGQETIMVDLLRKGDKVKVKIKPIETEREIFRIGVLIQDQLSGVGTLTYYDPKTRLYGGLGHNIYALDQPVETIENGVLFYSYVDQINKSEKHKPGDKQAHFMTERGILGAIRQHSIFGVFGELTEIPQHSLYDEPIVVAKPEDVEVGPAQLLTVLKGEKVERFDCEIIEVNHQTSPEIKSFVMKVTDTRLISETGGIVQGMSGSPIIQQGKFVGAVTHVFVDDPLKGYGVYLQWMLDTQNQTENQKAA